MTTIVEDDDIYRGWEQVRALNRDVPDLQDYGIYDATSHTLSAGWREGEGFLQIRCWVCGEQQHDEKTFIARKGRCATCPQRENAAA